MSRFPQVLCIVVAFAFGCSSSAAGPDHRSEHEETTRQGPRNRPENAAGLPDPADSNPPSAPSSTPNNLKLLGLSEALFPNEEAVLSSLRDQPIAQIQKGRGGRSLAFKVTLLDGTVGYFKPEQSFSAAHFYGELASYYLDRELGLGRVPPTTGRRVNWAPFRQAAIGDRRVQEITRNEDGTVRGAFIWWIPQDLTRIGPPEGWTRWLRGGQPLPINPYQRPREWSDDQGRGGSPGAFKQPGPPARTALPRELSTMILFDYLTTNVDRWGGNFTNVRTLEEGGPLIYLDNGAGFSAGPTARIPLMDARLHALRRFDAEAVERIRTLSIDALQWRMTSDPLWPFFSERQLEHLEERRLHLLEYVDGVTDAENKFF